MAALVEGELRKKGLFDDYLAADSLYQQVSECGWPLQY